MENQSIKILNLETVLSKAVHEIRRHANLLERLQETIYQE
jgi:hypothetical protein